MNIGEMNSLKVLRKTDIGYMLIDENNTEVFMHFNEADQEINVNDMVEVFLFFDKKHRLTASTKKAYVTLSKPGFLNVKDINPELGVFLDNNSSKDVFLSLDYLPKDFKQWPQINDKIIIRLNLKENNLSARLCSKQDIINEYKSTFKYTVGQNVTGYVCKLTSVGIGIISTDYQYIFVHQTMMREDYRLGQEVIVRINQVRDDEYNGSLLQLKEKMIDTDCEIILNYLKSHKGFMVYNAKSNSDEIEKVFKMSRKAFKRALGSLYKEHIITVDDEGTHLN